jgi:23S rRNA pseudouridine2604 synthase
MVAPLPPKTVSQDTNPASNNMPLRLSKRMSELGLASRREADEWIEKGWVRVDGEVVATLGAKVLPSQSITIEKSAQSEQSQRVTILLNKPIGYVSGQAEDGYQPAVVLVAAQNRWSGDTAHFPFHPAHARGLAPAGRLDIDSTGLLVLTQDGRIAKQLIGETSEVEKEYLVRVEGPLPHTKLALLNHGLTLDDVKLRPAKVEWANSDQLRFILTEGRKRQIRRMCEMVGLRVVALKRVRIGGINLGALPVGQFRYLRGNESFLATPRPSREKLIDY